MRTAIRQVFGLLLFAVISICVATAQSQTPIVVQAASPAAASAPVATAKTENSAAVEDVIKFLEQVKAKNDETLRKQEAALQQLDEMQQAGDQLKIFSRRG